MLSAMPNRCMVQLLADSEKSLVPPSQLDIYFEPKPVVLQESPPSVLQQSVGIARNAVAGYLAPVWSTVCGVYSAAVKVEKYIVEFYGNARKDPIILVSPSAITLATVGGMLVAGRGRKPIRRVLYGTVFGCTAAAVSYPKKAAEIADTGYRQAKVTATKLFGSGKDQTVTENVMNAVKQNTEDGNSSTSKDMGSASSLDSGISNEVAKDLAVAADLAAAADHGVTQRDDSLGEISVAANVDEASSVDAQQVLTQISFTPDAGGSERVRDVPERFLPDGGSTKEVDATLSPAATEQPALSGPVRNAEVTPGLPEQAGGGLGAQGQQEDLKVEMDINFSKDVGITSFDGSQGKSEVETASIASSEATSLSDQIESKDLSTPATESDAGGTMKPERPRDFDQSNPEDKDMYSTRTS